MLFIRILTLRRLNMSFSTKFLCIAFACIVLGLVAMDHVSAMPHLHGQQNNNGVIQMLVAGLIAKLLQENNGGFNG
ncbi:hypothetical protein JTE90_005270 [Oedothorax gibbosus]|uniref:Uncharacterized protein n=1 Tax=Oedothorax gibbosus TaxID=931172 RepID=A0AAV6U1R2_9ARAC|nr:hypothetical protein JTE90_005270 [Oedothorax gibbosus]